MLFDRIWYPESFRKLYQEESFPRSLGYTDDLYKRIDEEEREELRKGWAEHREMMKPPPSPLAFADVSLEKKAHAQMERWEEEMKWGFIETAGHPFWLREWQARASKTIAKVCTAHGIPTVPIYSSDESFINAFLAFLGIRVSQKAAAGRRNLESAYVVIVDGLKVPREEDITWEQVVEFRRDQEALARYRALRTWVCAEMKGKTAQEISDLIGVKLDRYEWALEKHGIKTAIESVKQVLSVRTIMAGLGGGAVGVSTTGDPKIGAIVGILASTFSAVSSVMLKFAEIRLEEQDILKTNPEIALIYDARARFGKGT